MVLMAQFSIRSDNPAPHWIGVRVPMSDEMRGWERKEHLARIREWLSDPTLAGHWYWFSVAGDGALHIKMTSPNTAFACKMRWG